MKPLTVLIGANNTGKSYLALTFYSLGRAVNGSSYPRYGSVRQRRAIRRLAPRESSVKRFRNLAVELKSAFVDSESLLSHETEFSSYPPRTRRWMRNESRLWADPLARNVDYELQRCFGTNLGQLSRKWSGTGKSDFKVSISDQSAGFKWEFGCKGDELQTENWEATEPAGGKNFRLPRIASGFDVLNDPDLLAHFLTSSYSNFLLSSFSAPIHYLPASRSGILQGHKTLASLIIGKASSGWIEPMEVDRLPGVITDLIRAILLLEPNEPTSPRMARIADFLETDVVKGIVDIKKELEYPEISYNNESGQFQMHQVSSMVSEIAPLILFVKYLVRPGHILILEEPESHLDPANQSRLARAIAMMVNAGVRVLVTTHSDIFLNQLNNSIQAFGLPSRRRLRMGYKATEILDPEKVGAYVFPRGEDGTHVEELPIEPSLGISTASFVEVHSALYDEAIRMERIG